MQAQLAIASVLPQEWRQLYEEMTALKIGTIFRELNMPFYLAEELVGSEKMKTSGTTGVEEYAKRFAAYDALLYLDTHPQDQKALDYYKQVHGKAYEPWNGQPLPWEGGAVNVVL